MIKIFSRYFPAFKNKKGEIFRSPSSNVDVQGKTLIIYKNHSKKINS